MAAYMFGKLPAKKDPRTLMFKKYLKPGLPEPPPAYNSLDRFIKTIGTDDVETLFPMLGNDRYGDCVMAGIAHAQTNFHALTGKLEVMSEAEVIRIYFELSGGVDSGLSVLSTLKHWKREGIGHHKIEGFVGLEEHDHSDIKNAIMLFGGVPLGFRVQNNAVSDFEHGKPWQPGPTDGGGHLVLGIAWKPNLVGVLTWGQLQWGTWEWWDAMVDESYCVLPPEARLPDFAPGYDFAALEQDIQLIAA
jgi:hypothetical protein